MKQMKTSDPSRSILSLQIYGDGIPIVDNAFKKTQQMFDNSTQKGLDSVLVPTNQTEKVKLVQEQIRRQHMNQKMNNSKIPFSPARDQSRSRNSLGTFLKKTQQETHLIDGQADENENGELFPNASSHHQLQSKHKMNNNNSTNAKNTKFQDLIRMLKAKIYFKQWRKFMPSRVIKVLGTWHYNLLSDKTIGFETDKKFLSSNETGVLTTTINGNNAGGLSKFGAISAGGIEEGYYNSELKAIHNADFKFQSLNFVRLLMQRIPIISASGNFRLFWDIIQMIIIMAFQCFLPLYITFKVPFYEIVHPILAYCMYFLLVFDIFINMNTSYYEKGKQVTERKRIIVKYLKTSFVMDILPVIPITIDFLVVSIEDSLLRYILLVFIVKLKRMYKILGKISDRFHLISSINSYMQLFQLLIMHLLISHYFACLWVIVGKAQEGTTWMTQRLIANEDWPTQYVNSYYFITLTMITVGYGDITPSSNIEIALCIGIMTFACGVFAYSVNEIGTLIQDLRSSQKEIKNNLQTIQKYMHNKNISNELKYEIREYLLYYWTEESNKNGEKENTIINQLSDSLKETLVLEANHLVLSDSPVFRDNFSPEILKRTVPLITEFRCTPEEVIYCEGETDEGCIYFIEKGSIELYMDISTGQNEQFKALKQLKKGDNFGAIGFFSGLHRTQSVRSLEFTTLLMIKRNEFLKILKEYPQDYERFCLLRDKIMVQHDYEKLGLRCYSCSSFHHVLNDCPYLHYVANRFRVIRNAITGENTRDKTFERVNIIRYRRTLQMQSDIEQQARIYYEENEELIDYLYEHLESHMDGTTQNDNPSLFKMESLGGKEFMPLMSMGQEEDIRSQSVKGGGAAAAAASGGVHRRPGKHRNTLLPALPQIRTRQSYDGGDSPKMGHHMPITMVSSPTFIVEPRRNSERKGTIQIVHHRSMIKKLTRIPTSDGIGGGATTGAAGGGGSGAVKHYQPPAVSSMPMEKSIERQPTEKNLTQFATAQNIIEGAEFILIPMDLMKSFVYYFPHNNFDRVIKKKNIQGKNIEGYMRGKRKSKRSTIRSTNKVETSSINSLFNKFEQQRDSEENGKIVQQASYFKSLSKGTNFSQRHSMKHNSNFSMKSNANTLRSKHSSNMLPNINDDDDLNSNNEFRNTNNENNNVNLGDENLQNQSSKNNVSLPSDVELTISCPAIPLDVESLNKNPKSSWGFQAFGSSQKINHFVPQLLQCEERNQAYLTI